MLRFVKLLAAVPVAVALMAACAKGPAGPAVTAKLGPVCETASGQATSFGRATAQLYAQAALRSQVAEIRGELLQAGRRRVRVSQPVNECQPLTGAFQGAGLAHCRAFAQVCAR
jgi:hypothetical protein